MIADATQNWKVGRPRTEMKSRSITEKPDRRRWRTPVGGLKVAKEGKDEPQLFLWDTRDQKKTDPH